MSKITFKLRGEPDYSVEVRGMNADDICGITIDETKWTKEPATHMNIKHFTDAELIRAVDRKCPEVAELARRLEKTLIELQEEQMANTDKILMRSGEIAKLQKRLAAAEGDHRLMCEKFEKARSDNKKYLHKIGELTVLASQRNAIQADYVTANRELRAEVDHHVARIGELEAIIEASTGG